jgi:hypothetical protein
MMKGQIQKAFWKSSLVWLFFSSVLFVLFHHGSIAPAQASPTVDFVVANTFDAADLNPGDTHCDASGDPGDQCTLRAAIQETNALAGAQTIQVNSGNYLLTGAKGEDNCTSGDLDIKDDLTIIGENAQNTIIDGGATDRIFHIFYNVSANIRELTMRNGAPGNLEHGGAILNEQGALTLEDSEVLTSTATYGGGIFILGGSANITLIKNSMIHDNRAAYGGGIQNGGKLTLENSEVSANRINSSNIEGGGGIHNTGQLTATDSLITDNHNPYTSGGGIYNKLPGTLTLTGTTVSDNTTEQSGAGIYHSGGTLSLTESTISGNTAKVYGGGIFSGSGSLSVLGSTINGNKTNDYGGGLFILDTSSALTNSTISGNNAADHGGGLYIDHYSGNDKPIYLSNVTITANRARATHAQLAFGRGGGIYIESEFTQSVIIKNSILANNYRTFTIPAVWDDCYGILVSQDYNLIREIDGCTITGQTSHNQTGISPQLSTFGEHGGPTQTHMPQAGSPVIDKGNSGGCKDDTNTNLLTDQRGYSRHFDGDGDTVARCDIGAVEFIPNPIPTLTSLNPSSTQAGGAAFTLTVNGSNFVDGAVVQWNGTDHNTTYISATQLSAQVQAADIASQGSASITATNPEPGGGVSNTLNFTISPAPGGTETIFLPMILR